MDTISDFNNHIPHRDTETPFKIWINANDRYLRYIFEIFLSELEEIKDTEANYIKFARKIYKMSSRLLC